MRGALGFLALAMVAGSGSAWAQTVRPDFFVTNGAVHAIARSEDRVYVGGSFTQVGRPNSGGASLDPHTGESVEFPEVRGSILALVSDRAGGWYVGGDFSEVGGVARSHLAHIRADRSVSPWNPAPDGAVTQIALNGRTLYVMGDFRTIGGQERPTLAALDVVTGNATAWNPDFYAQAGWARRLVVSGPTIYVGGHFSVYTASGERFPNLVALDSVTALPRPWNPFPLDDVYDIAVWRGRVYVAGPFREIAGQPCEGFVALDSVTARVRTRFVNDGGVHIIALAPPYLYAGGTFHSMMGAARNGLAAFEIGGPLVPGWAPEPNGFVGALAAHGDRLYVGGGFTRIGGEERPYLSALEAWTGRVLDWNPWPNAGVTALSTDGSRVEAVGNFDFLRGVERRNLAAFDPATGAVTDWNPGVNDVVRALAIDGPVVYAGGSFDTVATQRRRAIAALDAATGSLLPWNPGANGSVRAIAIAGGTLYAGGNFTRIGGQDRGRLAALDLATGAPSTWNPDADSTVRSLVVEGATVYAGGSFSRVGGAPRARLAALDRGSGVAIDWNPGVSGGGCCPDVYALTLAGTSLYVGGDFTVAGGEPRGNLAVIDAASGITGSWNPNLSGTVYALAPRGQELIVGGAFLDRYGAAPAHLAAIDRASGLARPAYPEASGPVLALDATNSSVVVGGEFGRLGGDRRQGLAWIDEEITTATLVALFQAERTPAGVTIRWSIDDSGRPVGTGLERAEERVGPWTRLDLAPRREGTVLVVEDEDAHPDRRYFYRLVVALEGGGSVVFGPIPVAEAGEAGGDFALARISPSPTRGPATIEFVVARTAPVRLEILDLQGRVVATLVDGARAPGRYQVAWNGDLAAGAAPPGLYFVCYRAAERRFTGRIVIR